MLRILWEGNASITAGAGADKRHHKVNYGCARPRPIQIALPPMSRADFARRGVLPTLWPLIPVASRWLGWITVMEADRSRGRWALCLDHVFSVGALGAEDS